MPISINRMILMGIQHDMERGLDLIAPIKTQIRVICIQQGMLEEHAGDNKEFKAIIMV